MKVQAVTAVSLTIGSRVLLEKLEFTGWPRNSTHIFGTRKYVTVFTGARPFSLS
jgi:hypothetical protein